jgi:hypothetical protein
MWPIARHTSLFFKALLLPCRQEAAKRLSFFPRPLINWMLYKLDALQSSIALSHREITRKKSINGTK